MRTKNSIKNIIIALCCNVVTLLINFFSQKLLIQSLGIEYSGLNSVLSNIISMLSISELGIGTAIIYHLYKPISENDIPKIKSLMNFYKKAYNIIALVILVIGISILPFLSQFIEEKQIAENIYLVYLIFLSDSVISYLATYKRSLIYANQKNRVVDLIHVLYVLLMNSIQIFILINYKNYIAFLIVKVLCRGLENIIITVVANKLYPYLKDKTIEKIDSEISKDIKSRVGAQIFHSIGGYIVLGTDNLLISKFLGLTIAGIYGNYILIINAANVVLSQIFSSITASVGNLLVEGNSKKNYDTYKRISFVNFIVYTFCAIIFYFAINNFIRLWLGTTDYLFNNITVLLLTINFYMQGMRKTMQTFATAAGICRENKYVPIIESTANLVFSIILLKFIGINGVILGTIISTFVLFLYGFPKYIYSPIFKKDKIKYISEFIKYSLVFIVIFVINIIVNLILPDINPMINIILSIIIHCIIVSIMLMFIYHKNNQYIWIKQNLLKKIRSNGKNE